MAAKNAGGEEVRHVLEEPRPTGGRTHDGCHEFMLDASKNDPAVLDCAACGCHRSFHLRDGEFSLSLFHQMQQSQQEFSAGRPLPYQQALHNYQLMLHYAAYPQVLQQVAGEMNEGYHIVTRAPAQLMTVEERREKIRAFAERLEWRVRRQDEHALRLFGSDIGVSQRAFPSRIRRNRMPEDAGSSENSASASVIYNSDGSEE